MTASTNPWDWMQEHDTKRMGDVILDPLEQQRWCRAVMLGGLPYMWRVMADTVRTMMYDKLELRAGDSILIIGESVGSCGFADDIQTRVGPTGSVRVIDITDEARDAYISGKRGRTNQLATWEWEYTREISDEAFDCVAVLQAVQHTDDWREQGAELLRLMKPGRNLLLGEITFSPRMPMLAQQDIHIEYWLAKIMSRVGWDTTDFPYYSIADLEAAFAGRVLDPHGFVWKGIELFWGTKP